MKTTTKYVGQDVHKDTTVIAVADGGSDGEVRLYSEISSDLGAREKVLRRLGQIENLMPYRLPHQVRGLETAGGAPL